MISGAFFFDASLPPAGETFVFLVLRPAPRPVVIVFYDQPRSRVINFGVSKCIDHVDRQSNVPVREVSVSALLARLHCLIIGEYLEKTNRELYRKKKLVSA